MTRFYCINFILWKLILANFPLAQILFLESAFPSFNLLYAVGLCLADFLRSHVGSSIKEKYAIYYELLDLTTFKGSSKWNIFEFTSIQNFVLSWFRLIYHKNCRLFVPFNFSLLYSIIMALGRVNHPPCISIKPLLPSSRVPQLKNSSKPKKVKV